MGYHDVSKPLAGDPCFLNRVKFALLDAAIDIAGEQPDSYGTVQKSKRQDLAFAALQGGDVNGTTLSRQDVLTNFAEAIASKATNDDWGNPGYAEGDVEVKNQVAAYWDDLAGVTYDDTQTS